MKKVLITGGVGTVGSAFIKTYYDQFEFYNYSRSEKHIAELKSEFPTVTSIIGDIQHLDHLINVFERVKPDIVIHAAAIKHVNLAEENPSKTVQINLIGSLNVIKASIRAEVPITIGISTDKACEPENVYGYTKRMMEQMFMEHYNEKTKFVCTRFANVTASNGSVIPFWLNLAKEKNALRLTHPSMNRLMFSTTEASHLIYRAYEYGLKSDKPFILSSIMKSVNMLNLANSITNEFNVNKEVEIVGLRPGEKLNETLISDKELEDAFITEDENYVVLYSDQFGKKKLTKELSSLTAEFMNDNEIKALYK